MSRKGLLIDYEYCCGCHTCEVACQKEHGYEPHVWGIKVLANGPHIYEERNAVVFDYIPAPTNLCDLCIKRTSDGSLPTCVHHCQTGCMQYGEVADLVKELEKKPNQVLFVK